MIVERNPVALRLESGYALVAPTGELDVATAPELRTALVDAVASPLPGVVVDLSQVSFIDSSGLGVLVGGLKRARTNGQWMRLVCPSDGIVRLFEITGLTKVFDLFATLDAALGPEQVPAPAESPEA
jgi:anti-sigma B factor antagonist